MNDTEVRYALIPGFPGYRVGTDGSVWSQYGKGHTKARNQWTRIVPASNGWDRLKIALRKENKSYQRQVHRLVLECFVGPCPSGMEACHRNGKSLDNRLDNLRWDTPQSNQHDRMIHGTDDNGSKSKNAKISEEQAIEIVRLRLQGRTLTSLGKQFGISPSQAGRIAKGQQWKRGRNGELLIIRESTCEDGSVVAVKPAFPEER